MERVLASTGKIQAADSRFETSLDIPNGGVLWALPALIANGLLRHIEKYFSLPNGFYSAIHIFLLLGYIALCRIKTIEQLRYEPAGEWGKLLGLDRIPEVKTLRDKVEILADREKVGLWSGVLSKEWMEGDPEAAGVLYVDGHIRVYHGSQTKLPRRYIARQRLCLRGMTDYWVNDRNGNPFFVISTPFTTGLLDMLKQEIMPRLIRDIPQQPTEAELEANAYLYRFIVIFDREGYSPEFFACMWSELRIACLTYHKYPGEDWPEWEFRECLVKMSYGNEVKMHLAERGIKLSNGLWVREIRKLTETGHQTSVLSTDYISDMAIIGGHMFSRWSQENFFNYMVENYNIDGLIDYETASVDETKKVVNPAYRKLEGQIKSKAGKLGRKLAEFGEITLKGDLKSKEIEDYENRKGTLKETIDLLNRDLAAIKEHRKQTPRHISLAELSETDKFKQLAPNRKQLIDTIKMLAYRAETALSVALRGCMARTDDSRSLLREIFTTEADLIPNEEDGTLTVRLHHLTNHSSDKAAVFLAEYLNASETYYPGTNLRLIYKLVSDLNPPGQEF